MKRQEPKVCHFFRHSVFTKLGFATLLHENKGLENRKCGFFFRGGASMQSRRGRQSKKKCCAGWDVLDRGEGLAAKLKWLLEKKSFTTSTFFPFQARKPNQVRGFFSCIQRRGRNCQERKSFQKKGGSSSREKKRKKGWKQSLEEAATFFHASGPTNYAEWLFLRGARELLTDQWTIVVIS